MCETHIQFNMKTNLHLNKFKIPNIQRGTFSPHFYETKMALMCQENILKEVHERKKHTHGSFLPCQTVQNVVLHRGKSNLC